MDKVGGDAKQIASCCRRVAAASEFGILAGYFSAALLISTRPYVPY